MRTLINQTIYQCSYCNRRLLSKNGAKLHEESYCKKEASPHMTAMKEKQTNCPHENVETQYAYIPGEAVQEPDYELCIDCGYRW